MLNLALVGLLAGSLVSTAPDGDKDKHRSQNAPAAEATAPEATPVPEVNLGLVPPTDEGDPRVITADTYAFGRPVTEAPIKLWVHYAWGESEGVYDFDGETIDIGGDIVVNAIGVGAHINFLNFPAFQLGAGAQLNVSQRKFQAGEDSGGTDIESDFGLQGVKVYGSARGRVLGVHGGYFFDLGSEAEFDGGEAFGGGGTQTRLANSDGRSASFVGVDFDYPSERFRLFGGFDYFILEGADAGELDGDSTFPDGSNDGDDILAWVMGAGLRFGGFEIGAALQLQTQLKNGPLNTTGTGVHLPIGGHLGSVSPYLRFSPTFFPASIFVQGGVNPEYVTRGYAIGGANAFKPSLGFTAGITVGFD
jgi:hypothetical protein